jgi:hypothetical protein
MSTVMSKPGINDFHNSNFKVYIDEFPGLTFNGVDVFHNFIRSITLPSFSLETMVTKHMGEDHLHNVGSHKNSDVGDLGISFKVSESLLNYFGLANYMQSVRYQDNQSDSSRMKDYHIGAIIVELLNNQKTPICRVFFRKVVPTNISGLSLDYTNGSVLTFDATFKFEQVNFELLSES